MAKGLKPLVWVKISFLEIPGNNFLTSYSKVFLTLEKLTEDNNPELESYFPKNFSEVFELWKS